MLRLDKFLADQGLASRREIREWIRSGRVSVDGSPVREPERKVDPERDQVAVDAKPVSAQRFHTFMMDKPLGVVTATEDASQKTVLDLLPPEMRRMGLFPVGRLDKDTSGLLLLTNDGDLSHRVISPRSAVEKRYYARVEGKLDTEDVTAFQKGLVLGDGTQCLPALLEIVDESSCTVTVTEGKYHQVRRMLASRGKPVQTLRRISIGDLSLGEELKAGEWKELTEEDLCRVFKSDSMGILSKNEV